MATPMFPMVFATIFTTIAVLFIALAFATDHWQETIIVRKELEVLAKESVALQAKLSTPLYFSRDRGMFRTCYPGNNTLFLDAIPNKVDNCIPESGYELERNPDTIDWGSDYETRMHLMRAHFAFFVVALLLLVIASIMGAVGCWRMDAKVIRATGLVAFFGAFFALGGMAFFHGYEYIENALLDQLPQFPAYWTTAPEHFTLASYYTMQYGYSYMLGWIGVGMAAIAAVLFLCAAMSAADIDGDDKSPLAMKERNRAYDYMGNQSMVSGMAGPQQPVSQMMSPYQQPQQQQAVPQIMYADYGQQQAQPQFQQQPQIAYMPQMPAQYAAAAPVQYAAPTPAIAGYDVGTYGRY